MRPVASHRIGLRAVARRLLTSINDFLLLEPAFALPYGSASLSMHELLSKPTEFHTGPEPHRDSHSGRIIGWSNLKIARSGWLRKNIISYSGAQKEVAKLLSHESSTHEYLTYEAAKLCSSDPLVSNLTLHLVAGSLSEDFVFAPNERFKNIVVHGNDFKLWATRTRLTEYSHEENMGIHQRLFLFFKRILDRFLGGKNDANRPYFAHFYDPSVVRPDYGGGLQILHHGLTFQGALGRMKMYWKIASDFYSNGELEKAFCALGHILHLIEDLHVPAHVHNDIHGPTLILGNLDSLEMWLCKSDYVAINHAHGEPNVRMWSSKPLAPQKPLPWNPDSLDEDFDEFVNSIALDTKRFRSVDAWGTDPGENRKGPLDDEECFYQAKYLIPAAITRCAQLIATFVEYQKKFAKPS